MIIGIDAFGDTETMSFQTVSAVNQFFRLTLGGAVFDEVYAERGAQGLFNFSRQSWSFLTLLHGTFQNSLEAGNVTNQGMPIQNIQIRKRKIDSLAWVDLVLIPFNVTQNIYQFVDRLIQATEIYEYMMVPLTSNVRGTSVTASITCEFDSVFLVDRNTSYKLYANLEYGTIDEVLPSSVVETFTQYPTVLYGQPDYKRGSIKSMVITDRAMATGAINARDERLNRERLMSFLKDRRPKVLKDGAGRMYMVAIVAPREIPNNNLAQGICDIEFEWIQVGDLQSIDRWGV